MRTLTLAAALCVAAVTVAAQSTATRPAPAQQTRIGVFDSRLVALAYYNSEEHRQLVRRISSDMQNAKAAGDKARIAELEFQGPALQNLMHYQVFSNASIPNITGRLQDQLPAIAEEQRVVMIVSKWDVAYHRPDVEYVDVTDAMVRRFNPSAKVLQWIAEGRTKEPMPLLDAVMTLRPDR